MKVAPLAMLSAVMPPSLLKVLLHTLAKEALGDRFVVCACFLKTTMSIGVTQVAIKMLAARLDNRMLTN